MHLDEFTLNLTDVLRNVNLFHIETMSPDEKEKAGDDILNLIREHHLFLPYYVSELKVNGDTVLVKLSFIPRGSLLGEHPHLMKVSLK